MLLFNNLVTKINNFIETGHIEESIKALDELWLVVGQEKQKRTVAHHLGNEIQKAIFAKYVGD